jgi:arylsulfatase A-like enzyme
MPTLLSFAGVNTPSSIQGRDMSGVLKGDDSQSQDSVFIDYPVSPDKFSFGEWRGVITEKYTYARFRENPWVLYDDENDPYQLENLIDNGDLVGELDKELTKWLEKLNDPFETSYDVAEKYYRGSINGVMPYYENDKIKNEKERRASLRKNVK